MDYNALRQGIHEEATNGTLEILSESGTDILVFDYNDSKEINFHMIPPTREWLASRIVWGPSLTCDAIPAWTAYLADYLYRVDPNMFVCLNRIIVIDDSADRKAIATLLGVDEDNLPEENEDLIGQLWLQENCVFLNANYPAKKGTRNFSVSLPGGVSFLVIRRFKHALDSDRLFAVHYQRVDSSHAEVANDVAVEGAIVHVENTIEHRSRISHGGYAAKGSCSRDSRIVRTSPPEVQLHHGVPIILTLQTEAEDGKLRLHVVNRANIVQQEIHVVLNHLENIIPGSAGINQSDKIFLDIVVLHGSSPCSASLAVRSYGAVCRQAAPYGSGLEKK